MRLARWIVRRCVPTAWQESLLGDLLEEAARRRRSGRVAGSWWAVGAATSIAWRLRREALDGRAPSGGGWRRWGAGLSMDLRNGVRALRATPGFTGVAMVVLALGIGATTAIYTVVDVALLRPMPFEAPHRLMVMGEVSTVRPPAIPGYVGAAAIQNYRAFESLQSTFASLGASSGASVVLRDDGEPERLYGSRATAGLFEALRVRPSLGRALTPADETEGRDRVVLISEALWRRRFASDPGVVGRRLTTDAGAYEIVGVLPPGFKFPVQQQLPVDFVMPQARTARQLLRDRTQVGRTYSLRLVGRLKDGVTPEQAEREFDRIAAGLKASHPDWFEDMTMVIAPMHINAVGQTRDWMMLLLGAVACVLLVACANVANLMLARASVRSREWLVRSALGASRWRLLRAALVESVVLAGLGLAAAVVVAGWGISLFRAAAPAALPRLSEMTIDLRILLFAAVVALGTGVLCGLLPAWHVTRRRTALLAGEGMRGGTAGAGKQRLRAGLVVAEVALAVMLVVGAGLFLSSYLRVVNVHLGMDIRHVLSVNVDRNVISDSAGGDGISPVVRMVMDQLAGLPGVEGVAAVGSGSPLSGSWRSNTLTVPGSPPFSAPEDQVQIKEVTPAYRHVLRVPLTRGRYVTEADTASAPAVVVLNEEAVRRFFGARDPIGSIVRLDDRERVVIGVVSDVRVRGPEVPIAPEAYFPLTQRPSRGATVLVRTNGRPEPLLPTVKDIVLRAVPGVPVTPVTLESQLQDFTAQRQFNMLLVGVFGGLALLIAAVGVFGVMAFLVAQQSREFGVRMALGAQPSRVVSLVLGRAGGYVMAGVGLGLGGAWLAAGAVEGFLFEVGARDPWVYVSSASVLVATGLLAAWWPARRAARVDPVTVLRAD